MLVESDSLNQHISADVLKTTEEPGEAEIVEELVRWSPDPRGGAAYHKRAADLLAVAAAWAYSAPEAFSFVMHRRGISENYYRHVAVGNDALFVDASAFLLQSKCGRLGILCFRGTVPTNIISWLTDASVDQDRFQPRGYHRGAGRDPKALGRVHGGFYRNLQAIWPLLEEGLNDLIAGVPIGPAYRAPSNRATAERTSSGRDGRAAQTARLKPMEALYITGHSLGGAMAAIAAATLRRDESCADIWKKVRGVYTFGQPMVGDRAFAGQCKDFEDIVFRHVYDKDIVPKLPPVTTGWFQHFGREYRSTKKGWRHRAISSSQVLSTLSLLTGVLSFVKQRFVATRWLKLPVSWDDHSPLYYMRVSQRPFPRSEFE